MEIREFILKKMQEKGFKKSTIAKAIGVDPAQFRRMLNGATINTSHLDALSQILKEPLLITH